MFSFCLKRGSNDSSDSPGCFMANFSDGQMFLYCPTDEHTHIPVGNFSTCSSIGQSSVVFPDLSVFTYLIEKYSQTICLVAWVRVSVSIRELLESKFCN